MSARTGKEFLEGLKTPREIWVGNERVADVTSHPAFTGAAQELASVFDLQHAEADRCLVPDPETSEKINASHLIPRSREDLFKRHQALEVTAEHSVGLMGRTPDYMNVTFAGFAARPDEWSLKGNEKGAENLVAFQKEMRRKDLSLTHTIIHPTIDKALGDVPKAGNDVALHKVGETEHGIIVRGSRILATLAPFSDEMAVSFVVRVHSDRRITQHRFRPSCGEGDRFIGSDNGISKCPEVTFDRFRRDFIVSHSVVLGGGQYLGRKTFTPADMPVSTYTLPAGYKGPVTVTSTCNLHDFWTATITV